MRRFSSRPSVSIASTKRQRRFVRRRLSIESLEDRRVLAPLMVTTTEDIVNSSDELLSLREAIQTANETPGPNDITFAGNVHGTISLTETLGQLEITDDLKILGPGAHKLAISGGDEVRVFYIAPAIEGTEITVSIAGLEITQGLADQNAPIVHSIGGGILNEVGANLTLEDVVVSHNKAVGDASITIRINALLVTGSAVGGGVFNFGTLVVTGSTFDNNQAHGASGTNSPNFPGTALAGGLANLGTATVTDCEFTSNLAHGGSDNIGSITGNAGDAGGGAILNAGFGPSILATLAITGSRFSHNQIIAGNDNRSGVLPGHTFGGAVASLPLGGIVTLNVSDSIFDHNQAIAGDHNVVTSTNNPRGEPNMSAGGGLFAQGMGTISDTTFEHNQAIGGEGVAGIIGANPITVNGGDARGGGLDVAFAGTNVTVSNCKITDNLAMGGQAGVGGTGGSAWGGGVGNSFMGATLTITGSVIDDNLAQGGSADTSGPASNGGDGLGGGVFNRAGSQTDVTDSSISHNQAIGGAGSGGGNGGHAKGGGLATVAIGTFSSFGGVTVSDSTVADNLAQGGALGGGMFNDSGETLNLVDVVVSGNQAVGATNVTTLVNNLPLNGVGIGGGVANLGTVTVSGSTFARWGQVAP